MKRQSLRRAINLISFLLFPAIFYYLSPYLIIWAASQGSVSGSFILFGSMFLSSLLLGRAYCGWICPVSALQDACINIKDKKVYQGKWIKWVLWVPWITAMVLVFWQAGGIKSWAPFFATQKGLSAIDWPSYITYFIVLALVVSLAWLIGRRSFCHHACWMAPFMILGRSLRNIFRWPSLGLHAESKQCTKCLTCTKNCPMSLPVDQMVASNKMEKSDCIYCGTCVDNCPNHVIRYRFGA